MHQHVRTAWTNEVCRIAQFLVHKAERKTIADCTCFYSALSKTSIFEAATGRGPTNIHGSFDESARAEIQRFIAKKLSQPDQRAPRNSTTTDLHLPLATGEIRVLELLPDQRAGPLRGKLHTVSVDFAYEERQQLFDQPDHNAFITGMSKVTYKRHTNHAISLATSTPFWYTALSYVWGAPDFDHTISFEQGSVKITSSLAGALRYLRSTDQSVFLWIDQICINQPDVAEKVQQIPLMEVIYAHATNTVIWLGEDEDSNPSLAFETLETVFARLQGTEAQVTPADFLRLDFPPARDRSWWAVRQLFRRPWFTRLWTIQEAFLSKELFVKCGDDVACWDDFAAWCSTLDDSGLLEWLTSNSSLDQQYSKFDTKDLLPPQGATVVDSIQSDRLQGLTLVQKAYLLETLVSTRYAQATEPKDKIYGVLGMAESSIVPDYSSATTARDVYHAACVTQLPLLTFELLSCVDSDVPLRPSWVPDWSAPRKTEALGYLTKAWAVYCAGGGAFGKKDVTRILLSDDESKLTIPGKLFDTVRCLGCVNQNATFNIDNPQTGNNELASYIDMVCNRTHASTYPAQDTTIYDAFLNTLVAGRDGSGVLPPSPDHSEVFSLILDSITGHTSTLPGQVYSPRRQKGYFTLNSLRTRKPAKTLEDLAAALRAALKMRRFAITEKGYLALVPRGTQEGDVVVVFERACVPFVIRRNEDDACGRHFELLGEAYVHGIMKGEVMEMDDIHWENITLV
jgi:hypothetical protein